MVPRDMVHSRAGLPQKGATIICLEGASAAGKTTLSYAIAAHTGAAVIAKHNSFLVTERCNHYCLMPVCPASAASASRARSPRRPHADERRSTSLQQ
jgi:hypothetical protein